MLSIKFFTPWEINVGVGEHFSSRLTCSPPSLHLIPLAHPCCHQSTVIDGGEL